jgi:hypothetical protein
MVVSEAVVVIPYSSYNMSDPVGQGLRRIYGGETNNARWGVAAYIGNKETAGGSVTSCGSLVKRDASIHLDSSSEDDLPHCSLSVLNRLKDSNEDERDRERCQKDVFHDYPPLV